MWIPEQEYNELKKKIPIPCVDLVIINNLKEVLLVKRNNEPAKGEWWFPGGRVMQGETRIQAAERKLMEECGLSSLLVIEWKTFDIFIPDKEEMYISHGISTFFIFSVQDQTICLDSQSSEFEWRKLADWIGSTGNKTACSILQELANSNLI